MGRIKELAGQRFGRLIADHIVGESRGYKVWKCNCDCGGTIEAKSSSLTTQNVKSCGCLVKKHGMSKHPTYKIWLQLRTNVPPNNVNITGGTPPASKKSRFPSSAIREPSIEGKLLIHRGTPYGLCESRSTRK